jgi:hypothetical protein
MAHMPINTEVFPTAYLMRKADYHTRASMYTNKLVDIILVTVNLSCIEYLKTQSVQLERACKVH